MNKHATTGRHPGFAFPLPMSAEPQDPGTMLLTNRFTRLIENHAESLSGKWVDAILASPLSEGYRDVARQQLHDSVFGRFRKLGAWIENAEAHEREVAEHFVDVGNERAGAGIKVSELAYSLMLERDLLWRYVLDEGIITEGIDLHRAIEFSLRLNRFYEKALYFALVGHENHKEPVRPTHDEGFFDRVFEGFKHWLILQ